MTHESASLDTRTLTELRDSVGGDAEFLTELIDEFLDDAPHQLESLREASASGDAGTARRAAHTLKSQARTFGATALASLCQEAESAAVEGDLEAVLARVGAIGEEWDRVRLELADFRDGRA